VDTIITALVEGVLIPIVNAVTAPMPLLASSGILLLVFGAIWVAFAVALVRDPTRVDAAWRRVRAQPLVLQGFAWLLFLPVLAGVYVWRTGWPRVARLAIVGSLAGWNLLMFLPRVT
jgi:uncharacterized membrane protein YvlD (DUF360 family)